MKMMIMSMAMLGSLSYGSTDIQQAAKDITGGIVSVYSAAAGINHTAERDVRSKQEQKLYKVAGNLTPMAQEYAQLSYPQLTMR